MALKIGALTKLGLFFPVVCFIYVFDQTLAEQLYYHKGLLHCVSLCPRASGAWAREPRPCWVPRTRLALAIFSEEEKKKGLFDVKSLNSRHCDFSKRDNDN